jgi:DNA-binding ferritin-like protein
MCVYIKYRMTPFTFSAYHRGGRSNTRRNKRSAKRINKYNYSVNAVVATMTEMLHVVKLYHWRTHSYSEHKATDKLHEALSEQADSFVEKLLGSKNARANLTHMPLHAYNTLPAFKRRIEYYKQYLKRMPASLGTDLLNIRDELLGSLNQFSYLLTLH